MRAGLSAGIMTVFLMSGCATSTEPPSAETIENFHTTEVAAQAGDVSAQYELGKMLLNGLGTDADPLKAMEWFKKSAEGGFADAQYTMAFFSAKGEFLPPDKQAAAEWFRQAAEKDHAESQYRLGLVYLQGDGLKKDQVEAFVWLTLASEGGKMEAKPPLIEVKNAMTSLELSRADVRIEELRKNIRKGE